MMKNASPGRYSAASRRRHHGFTLIELVIAMVVAAMLAAIAIPSYSNYVRKSRRTEAKTVLLDLASLEERFYTTNNSYTSTPAQLGYSTLPFNTSSGYYSIAQTTFTAAVGATAAIPAGTPAYFLFTATPVAGTDQAKDLRCTSFTIDSTGVQGATGTDAANCWK
jgi:type IV pilus assembly protein PilE